MRQQKVHRAQDRFGAEVYVLRQMPQPKLYRGSRDEGLY